MTVAKESRVAVRVSHVELAGELVIPEAAKAVVVHGGFVDRVAPSRAAHAIAEQLARRAGIASLVVDLLTEDEDGGEGDAAPLRFEVALLAQRLAAATDWALAQPPLRHLPIGYAAEGTAAAAALLAASARTDVRAIASRAGRPDLAGGALENVRIPTLLVVVEDDDVLVAHNRNARTRLRGSELALVAQATMEARVADFLAEHLDGC